jgi:predicted esterase
VAVTWKDRWVQPSVDEERYDTTVTAPQPVLTRQGTSPDANTDVRAIALVLHGGQAVNTMPTTARQLAVLRLIPVARTLASAGGSMGLGVWRLRFRYRGWNKEAADPVTDVRWALRQLREQHGDVPIVLVGHSMGGRAALRAAADPGVVAVLALAPWVPPGEPVEQVRGRRLLVVHGTRDRMTSHAASKALVDAVRGGAGKAVGDTAVGDAKATCINLRRSGHAMLRRFPLWNELTTEFVLHAALATPPGARLAAAIAAGDSVL